MYLPLILIHSDIQQQAKFVNKMTESRRVDPSGFPPEAAALYQRMHEDEDPTAIIREVIASDDKDTKDTLNWVLSHAPEFQPVSCGKATILGWTEGDGVWVLEGSVESHRAYGQVCDENPEIEHTEAVKKAGGTYYEHCKFDAPSQESAY